MPKTRDQIAKPADGRPTRDYQVPNVARALSVMEFLAEQPRGCGVSEIARQLEVPKNSVFRIVSTLYARGYLNRDAASKTYRLGYKLLSLGYAVTDEHNLVEKSLDAMRQLRNVTEETVLLGTLNDGRGLVLEQVPSNLPVKVLVAVGHRFPLHTAAPGKAMLAFLPPSEQADILDRMPFERFNRRTITDKQRFAKLLGQVRRQGYAVDRAEEVDSLHCVAAPIFNHRGRPVASIWVTGPSYRLREEDFERVAEAVAEQARIISSSLGYVLPAGREWKR